jgi:hypothetical protein
MNTQKIDFSTATNIDRDQVKRNAEELRAEQTVRFIQGLGRILSDGYAKLANYGAVIHNGYRTPTALY